ncbi:MAG TPA: DUF3467 domain-containing protein [Bryobacteraceae bacterium]|nr:DUF3467 domain-containing protein [Bryobacteraceae bacterium]
MAVEITLPQEAKVFNAKDLEHRHSPNFLRIYANNAGFGINFFDLTIVFGEMVADADGKGMYTEDRVAVTMSLEHAQALMQALRQALDIYEKTHAPIRKVPGQIEQPPPVAIS